MKIALVHYWLVAMRGGERVLEELCSLYPNADVFTHVVDHASISKVLSSRNISTTFIANLPAATRLYRYYLPLMPLALENLDLRGYDLVISSESGPAKGVITSPHTLHICYCHTPMRYIWSMYQDYRLEAGAVTRAVMAPMFHRLRLWDVVSADRVDHFIANSHAVADRIRKYYRREAIVIPPPVDTEIFNSDSAGGQSYLFISHLVAYKRADQAVEAFNQMGKPLIVIGSGPERRRLKRMAGPTVKILGAQPLSSLKELYANCRALVFPGEEDFGIVPVEALAAGRPIIAYGRGGILDTITDGVNGILYAPQSTEGLIGAVRRFEAIEERFSPQGQKQSAERFSRLAFRNSFSRFVDDKMAEHFARVSKASQ